MQQVEYYTVDLTKIKGSGEFRCPKCGIEISPNDETQDVYTILEIVSREDCLEEIILQCNKCQSQIHLTGFRLLKRII